MYRILVTSKSFARYNPEVINELKEKGIQLVRAKKSNMTDDEIAEEISGYDGIVCGIDRIDRKVIEAGKSLKIIHMNGTGIDHIDVEAATEHHIYVGNCPGGNAEAVAELDLAILLAEARKVVKYSRGIYEGKWGRQVGTELYGKTMGVLGLGAIGRRFTELLAGFHMNVLGYDVAPRMDWVRENGVTLVEDPSEIFREADFISLNLPLLDSTRGIIDRDALKQMKKDVIIVNTARGGLIKTDDLVEALRTGMIRGAALDAFDEEPLAENSPLRDLDITLTPHLGASTKDTMQKVTRMIAEHLEEVLLWGEDRHMVNRGEF